MRLFTHNFLQCHVKGCNSNNFPLRISPAAGESSVKMDHLEAEYSPDFLRRFIDRLEWAGLRSTLEALQMSKQLETLPLDAPFDDVSDDILQALHNVLMQTDIKEASMTCPNCGHVYPIKEGIPNMLLSEAEV